ncbi:MAG: isochorismatase family protein [Anaerolineae bacterium]
MITKHRLAPSSAPTWIYILRRLGIQTVILTGVSTPYCVESTARDAFARDYQVITLADCTASKVLVEHQESLARLGRVFGHVATSEEIMRGWSKTCHCEAEGRSNPPIGEGDCFACGSRDLN